MSSEGSAPDVGCGPQLILTALPGIPTVHSGDDLGPIIVKSLSRAKISLADQDVILVTSKIVSRAEGCFVDLSTIKPSPRALELAKESAKDPRLAELILSESERVSRIAQGVLIVRHRLGFVSANAAIDTSNAMPQNVSSDSGPWVLKMPADPDRSAVRIAESLSNSLGRNVGVVITDSLGRPFRVGTVGHAVGVAGLPPVCDHRGRVDRFGRELVATSTAVADQLSAIADLLAGQSSESRPIIHARGLTFTSRATTISELHRDPDKDLYL